MRVKESRVVVTGASSGIGLAVAERLAGRGARVWAVARSREPLEDLARRFPGVTPVVADVTVEADRAALVAQVEADGPIDVLVNNAGVGWTGLVEEMPFGQVRHLFELNVLALVDLTQRVLPAMLARRRGQIVNVSSLAAFVAAPPLTVYSATKFAVQGFTDGLRRELNGRGVAVTAINPGPIATRFGARAGMADVGARLRPDVDAAGMGGLPVSTVARAVVRAIRLSSVPGYQTVSVPRAGGLARLGAVPGLRWVVDGFSLATRRVGDRGSR